MSLLPHHTTVELEMAHSRLIPTMQHGFTVITPAGGTFTLQSGRAAEMVRDALGICIAMELTSRPVTAGAQP